MDINGRLRQQVIAIMDEHQVAPLSDAVNSEIDRILHS
jgi:hypothetical protein